MLNNQRVYLHDESTHKIIWPYPMNHDEVAKLLISPYFYHLWAGYFFKKPTEKVEN